VVRRSYGAKFLEKSEFVSTTSFSHYMLESLQLRRAMYLPTSGFPILDYENADRNATSFDVTKVRKFFADCIRLFANFAPRIINPLHFQVSYTPRETLINEARRSSLT
jgi:hypothetical protein